MEGEVTFPRAGDAKELQLRNLSFRVTARNQMDTGGVVLSFYTYFTLS